jgi:hypothetical protein
MKPSPEILVSAFCTEQPGEMLLTSLVDGKLIGNVSVVLADPCLQRVFTLVSCKLPCPLSEIQADPIDTFSVMKVSTSGPVREGVKAD